MRDQLSAERRELPWVKIDKEYEFDGPDGKETLSDLFDGRSQLLIQHFMYGPDWDEGCPSCSFWADSYNGFVVHLAHRDVTMISVSRAPLDKLAAYKKRMGWSFKWVSSLGNDFNQDFDVSFTPEEMEKGEMYYNYKVNKFPADEAPGASVFYKNDGGDIFHTYSCYGRGLVLHHGLVEAARPIRRLRTSPRPDLSALPLLTSPRPGCADLASPERLRQGERLRRGESQGEERNCRHIKSLPRDRGRLGGGDPMRSANCARGLVATPSGWHLLATERPLDRQ